MFMFPTRPYVPVDWFIREYRELSAGIPDISLHHLCSHLRRVGTNMIIFTIFSPYSRNFLLLEKFEKILSPKYMYIGRVFK